MRHLDTPSDCAAIGGVGRSGFLATLAAGTVPTPIASSWQSDPSAYQAQADRVLAVSAELTDEQKMTAELYDNKILGLGFSALFAAQSHALDVAGFVEYDFLTNMAACDAAIAVWHHKRIFDAVRPATAIGLLYGDEHVTAWAGLGRGTASDLPGRYWQSYLPTADHPEYPSASTALCHAHFEPSVTAGAAPGRAVGARVSAFFDDHLVGTAVEANVG